LIKSGAAVTDWQALRRDLHARLGSGLRRRSAPVPVLLAPARFGGLGFNDFAQTHEWQAFDQRGDRILLSLPGEAHELARRFNAEAAHRLVVLAETAGELDRPSLRPIAMLFDVPTGLQAINLTLDEWPHTRGLRAMPGALREFMSRRATPPAVMHDPLRALSRRALDAAVSSCAGAQVSNLEDITRACEAAGLVALAKALERMGAQRNAVNSLSAAYLASEVAAGSSWA
jgi:hypothetical protein